MKSFQILAFTTQYVLRSVGRISTSGGKGAVSPPRRVISALKIALVSRFDALTL
jgi:hypothetical protein